MNEEINSKSQWDDTSTPDDRLPKDCKPPKRPLMIGVTAWIGIAIVFFWLVIALTGPFLAPYSQGEMISYESFAPPGEVGILGGDYIGRDIFSRLLFGARMTMGLALIATVLAFVIGGSFGFLAAAGGGWLDQILSRLNDAIMAFPSIMLALIVIASLGTSLPILIIMVCLIEATPVFRLSRALGMDISVMDFVEAARARGEGLLWIISKEIFPNSILPLAAEFGLRYTYSILFISALSFLGLGVQPPQADWGVMVRENMIGLTYGSPAAVIPAAAIGSLTVGINLIVDAFVERGNIDVSEEMI